MGVGSPTIIILFRFTQVLRYFNINCIKERGKYVILHKLLKLTIAYHDCTLLMGIGLEDKFLGLSYTSSFPRKKL